MTKQKDKTTRRVSAKQLRRMMLEMAETICEERETVTIQCIGNTFEIHLEGGTLNITINEKGGDK